MSINGNCTRKICPFIIDQQEVHKINLGQKKLGREGVIIITQLFFPTCRRGMTGRGCISRCLFSGSRGENCSLEPLHTPHFAKHGPNAETMLVAMVTFTKVSTCIISLFSQSHFTFHDRVKRCNGSFYGSRKR